MAVKTEIEYQEEYWPVSICYMVRYFELVWDAILHNSSCRPHMFSQALRTSGYIYLLVCSDVKHISNFLNVWTSLKPSRLLLKSSHLSLSLSLCLTILATNCLGCCLASWSALLTSATQPKSSSIEWLCNSSLQLQLHWVPVIGICNTACCNSFDRARLC